MNPQADPKNQRIYSFEVIDRENYKLALESPIGRPIGSNLSLFDLFSFDVPGDSRLRLNFESLFHKYEGYIEAHTQSLLAKLNSGSNDIKAEIIDLFSAKLLNFVRNHRRRDHDEGCCFRFGWEQRARCRDPAAREAHKSQLAKNLNSDKLSRAITAEKSLNVVRQLGFSGAPRVMSERSVFRSGWLVAIVAAIAVGSYLAWRAYNGAAADAAKAQSAPPAPIPVTVAPVRKADFPVYLYGLGVVEPYDTVTVSSRVDGEITKIDFKQGRMVKEGDILAQIDPRPYQAALDQAVAKKAQDEATLKNAQHDLQRYTTLEKEDSASRQQLDTQQAMVDQLAAQIKGDQASIDNAQTQLSYTTIRSPLVGKTGFRLIDPGNIVHASASTGIVTIVKLQPISVVFTAPEEDVPAINNALAAGTVPVDALSSDGLTLLSHGHLALVNNAVDQASGDIRMKATFANTDNILWPGLSVSTRLLLDTLKDVIVVPVDAVQRGPNGLYAWVVGKDDKVGMRDIKVAQEGKKMSVVTQGLSPDENVVTEGQSRLREGALVQPTAAPTPAPSPAKVPPDTISPAEAAEAAPISPVPSPAAVMPSATPSPVPSPVPTTPAAKAP